MEMRQSDWEVDNMPDMRVLPGFSFFYKSLTDLFQEVFKTDRILKQVDLQSGLRWDFNDTGFASL